MARRFATLPELGRCAVMLRGICRSDSCRALLVRQESSGGIYLILEGKRNRTIVPVISVPPDDLLRKLNGFAWMYAVDISPDE